MADKENQNEEEQDEDELKRREEERQAAQQLKAEIEAKIAAKVENRRKNLKPEEFRLSEGALRSLDGSVKKNTAFQRKLRTLTEQQRTALTADLKALNLTKYLQEAAHNIADAKLKLADVGCAVHLCTLLHQRYAEFSEMLLEDLQRIYQSPISKEDDKSAVVSKYRLGLRLVGELVLAGIVEQDVGVSLLLDMLSMVMTADEEGHPYLSVVVSFARHFAEDVARICPRKHRMMFSKFDIKPPHVKLLPEAKQEEFRQLLHRYFASLSQHLVREHKAMHKRERKNHQLLTSKGEIPEDRQAENEAAQKAYDKLLTSASTLADVLDEDMPNLPEYEIPQEESDISIELQFPTFGESDEADPNALWEDEETRQFYEGITDIKPFVPAIILEERKKTASESTDELLPESADQGEGEGEGREQSEAMEDIDEEKVLEELLQETEESPVPQVGGEEEVGEEEEEEEETADDLPEEAEGDKSTSDPSSPMALFDHFASRLPTMMNRKLVDELAVEFCMTHNTKLNRKKLARLLYAVEKNRMDLIPYYSRLVATLALCVDDVVPTLLEVLLADLRRQMRKKDQLHIHTKLKNIRFLAELTKFGLCPKPEAMKYLTLLLRDFTHHHIDMACLFLEHCGRFLLRSPDSNPRAKALLEILVRKKKVQHLDGRQKSLVDNALYYANPPSTTQLLVIQELPMRRYIKKLLYKDLNKLNTEKILRQVRKLDWRDGEVFAFTVACLSGVWNVKFNNIHCVANLLAGLKSYQEEAVIRVVDSVLEDIRLGLECNLPKMNQRRVSSIKFAGELYTYQLLESNIIFRTLYLLLQFGSNPDGTPSPLDPYDSYFRVRLVCILLDTCGQYFDRGSSRKRMDAFLIYFQCYLFSKRQPQPLEVDNLVRDTIESLRPQLEFFKTPQEAYEAALELERKYRDKIGNEEADADTGGEESDEEEEQREDGRGGKEEDEEEEDEEEGEGSQEEEEDQVMSGPGDNRFEEEPILKAAPALVKCQEDDEFVANFEKMLNEDLQGRKTEKVPHMDMAVPLHLKKGPTAERTTLIHDGGELKMKFKVMTKKGHKQQLKELQIPLDSDLTSGLKDRQSKMEDHEEMKQKVLDIERRQEEEDYQAMIAAFQEQVKVNVKKQGSSQQSHKKHTPSSSAQQQSHYRQHGWTQQSHGGQGQGSGRGGVQQSHGGQGQGSGRGGAQQSHGGQGQGSGRGGAHGGQGSGRGRGSRGRGGGRGGSGAGGGGNYRQKQTFKLISDNH